jgi:hypothetical protein
MDSNANGMSKVLTSVTGTSEFSVDLKARKRRGNAERPRCTRERRRVKLWEEPDQKLVTDDVRGGSYSYLGGVAITPPRAPQR